MLFIIVMYYLLLSLFGGAALFSIFLFTFAAKKIIFTHSKCKVTNNNATDKKVALTINVPDEMTYVELQVPEYKYYENKGYYK